MLTDSTKYHIARGLLFTGDHREKASIVDMLIEDGKITTISHKPLTTPPQYTYIDASGKWVTPGFIDTHTHYDVEVLVSPGLKESARHGVTTVVLGNCSVSAIFNNPEITTDNFSRVEAIPREVMLPIMESKKTWHTPHEWMSHVDGLPIGINVASFIGHSDIRVKAMGPERALSDNTMASPKEQEAMLEMLQKSLDAGFLGMSTMDNPWDKMDGDKYWSHKTPSFYATWKERKSLVELLRKEGAILQGAPNLVSRFNAANYMMASMGIFRKPLKTTMIAMIDLVGDRMVLPIVTFLTNLTNKLFKGQFRMQSPPVPFTVYYDGVDSVMFEEFPAGEAMRHLAKNIDERNALIRDPEFRKSFKAEIRKKFAPKVWHKDLSKTLILDSPDKGMEGKNFFQLSKEYGQHPVDTFLDLIIKYDKEIRWTTTIGNDRPEKYKHIYNFEGNVMSFSDSGAHLNNMAFYDFPLQMIHRVQKSIDSGNPIMTMEKCIWRLTKELADWFLLDTGHIAVGKTADLCIIDPSYLDSINEEVSETTIPEFNNTTRLVNRNPYVVTHVMVGGEVIYHEASFVEAYGTDRKYGRVLKRGTGM